MLSNLHTHSVFCDGKDTIEEMVIAAIEKGFDSLGFSGHYPVAIPSEYCMNNVSGYIAEVKRVKELYKNDIQIYLGIEEDVIQPANRSDYEYIISSAHYIRNNGKYYDVDNTYEILKEAVDSFGGDPVLAAERYYSDFCDFVNLRKPEIIGHFDLLTKFDESNKPLFMGNKEYEDLAEKFISSIALSGSLIEVNTGAISRGMRKTQYPAENLLIVLSRLNAPIIINSDCHDKNYLDCKFSEMRDYLKFLGFNHHYCLYNNEFIKIPL